MATVIAVLGSGVSKAITGGVGPTLFREFIHDGINFCEDYVGDLESGWVDRVRRQVDSNHLDDRIFASEEVLRQTERPPRVPLSPWLHKSMGGLRVRDSPS